MRTCWQPSTTVAFQTHVHTTHKHTQLLQASNLKFTSVELGEDVLAAIDQVHLNRRNPSLVD